MPSAAGGRVERLNLLMHQGSTFGPLELSFVNPDGSLPDLRDSVFRAQMRSSYDSPTAALTFTCLVDPVAMNKVNMSATAQQTAALQVGSYESPSQSVFEWDLEAEEPDGRVVRYFAGQVQVLREVTRP